MAPNPLSVWAVRHGLDPAEGQTELAWALFAAVNELERKLADCREEMDHITRMDNDR